MIIIVKGTSFYQNVVKTLPFYSLGLLEPQPDNVYDPFACAIKVNNELVGYLPRGWTNQKWGREIINVIKHKEGLVQLVKVGGFKLYNDQKPLYGLRLIL